MAEGNDSDTGEKEHAASQRKLDEARRKGDVPSSADLTSAAGYAGMALAAVAFGAASLSALGNLGTGVLARADTLAPMLTEGARPGTGGILAETAVALAPLFGLPMLAALAAVVAQRAFVVAPDKLQPRLSRISLLQNAQQKFGADGLVAFAKSAVKLVLMAVLVGVFLWQNLDRLLAVTGADPRPMTQLMLRMSLEFLVIAVAVMAVIGIADLMWQHVSHARKQRMTHREMRDEHRDTEGDPHARQARRQRGREIATNRMLADVPTADVVIVNPTHYAVALRWDRGSGRAPVCVAKGVDEVAARIRARAVEAGVPIRQDAATARALHAATEVGQEISVDQYRAVAAAIRFAEAMRKRAGGWAGDA